jgi:hypothetical protein
LACGSRIEEQTPAFAGGRSSAYAKVLLSKFAETGMERIVVSPSKVFQSIIMLGVTCLILAVALSIFSAFVQMPMAQQMVAMLGDGFKLCLGGVLALMGESKLSKKR